MLKQLQKIKRVGTFFSRVNYGKKEFQMFMSFGISPYSHRDENDYNNEISFIITIIFKESYDG